jgi:hypothetical protein
MCIPHGMSASSSVILKEKKRVKKMPAFNKKNLEPDPDFIDTRDNPLHYKKEATLIDKFLSWVS